jgi:hypothetical protein
METEREDRSEYVTMYVTPTAAKEFRAARDNKELQDQVIKRFVLNETDWLKDEMKEMDNVTLRYRAKLLSIRDSFSDAQDLYVKEIEELTSKSYEAFKPIEDKFIALKNSIKSIKNETNEVSIAVDALTKKVSYANYDTIERMLNAIDRFNEMSDKEKELVTLLLKK